MYSGLVPNIFVYAFGTDKLRDFRKAWIKTCNDAKAETSTSPSAGTGTINCYVEVPRTALLRNDDYAIHAALELVYEPRRIFHRRFVRFSMCFLLFLSIHQCNSYTVCYGIICSIVHQDHTGFSSRKVKYSQLVPAAPVDALINIHGCWTIIMVNRVRCIR